MISKPANNFILQKYVYDLLKDLSGSYPDFSDWYWNKVVPRTQLGSDLIMIYFNKYGPVGVSILKLKDKKLCTVRVLKEYEKKTYGIKIIEDSLKILNCDKPNCTVSEDLLHSFSRPFINLFKFDITKVWNGIYQKGKLEYEFNGTTNLKNKTIY